MAFLPRFLGRQTVFVTFALVSSLAACGGSTEGDTGAKGDSATDGASDAVGIDSVGVDVPGLDAPGVDASVDSGATCFSAEGVVPSVPFKVCTNDTDCTMKPHTTDCCGNSQLIGVSKSQAADYETCAKAWDAHFPACGCPAGPPKAEDGKTITDATAVVVKCTDRTGTTGICKTSIP